MDSVGQRCEHCGRSVADARVELADAERVAKEQVLTKVEDLARKLAGIPAPGSNAFVRGARSAGRRVRKLVYQIRREHG